MKCFKQGIIILLFLFYFLSCVDADYNLLNFQILDYDTMIGINNSLVRVYDNGLESENYTGELGWCLMRVSNGTKNIVISHPSYITLTNITDVFNYTNFTFKLQNLSTYSIMSLVLDDLGLNYAICVDNFTNCYPSGETVSLLEKRDYNIILMQSEYNISTSTITSMFTMVLQPMFALVVLIIIVVGTFGVLSRTILGSNSKSKF